MPTVVHFIGGAENDVRLEEDFDKVTAALQASEVGRFTRLFGDSRSHVTVYKSGIAYVEDAVEVEPFVTGL